MKTSEYKEDEAVSFYEFNMLGFRRVAERPKTEPCVTTDEGYAKYHEQAVKHGDTSEETFMLKRSEAFHFLSEHVGDYVEEILFE